MTTAAELDERYGRTRTGAKRLGWIAVGVVAALAIAVLAWNAFSSTAGEVDYDDLDYRVVDATSVDVTFQVTSGRQEPVACVVEALDETFGVVGWRVVEYPAADEVTQKHTETVATLAEATTGYVAGCWLR